MYPAINTRAPRVYYVDKLKIKTLSAGEDNNFSTAYSRLKLDIIENAN